MTENKLDGKAYIVTGPTSGIGRRTALELAKHGTIVLVGRQREKLDEMKKTIERMGQKAVSIVCDLSEMASVERAAQEIIALRLPVAALVNNAGIMQLRATQNSLGWDMVFSTDHLGPFALTEALVPHLPDGANVAFVGSATEDPERKPAVAVGFRGGRYISAEASARGEWKSGGSTHPGFDAYATSKQCNILTAMALARETPRLRFNAVEPGFNPSTGLGRDSGAFVGILSKVLAPILQPFISFMSTPERAGQVVAKVALNETGQTGIYYDDHALPWPGSTFVRDPKLADRVVAETRALLASVKK